MLVSFIIPAHNEEPLIGAAVDAVHAAGKELRLTYEVVVADDASTDRTAEIARGRGAVVVHHERRQIAATRNLGARAAQGEYLIFVDGDTFVRPEPVREAIAALDGGAAGGGGPMEFDGKMPLAARLLLPVVLAMFRWKKITGGAFLFCTRRAFDLAGGWDETLYAGEEIFLAKALKEHGDFVIVRSKVVTSGRKLRTHTFWEQWATMMRIVFWRPTLRSRGKLDLWYGPRRDDPHQATSFITKSDETRNPD